MKNFRKVLALILVVATLFSFVAMASARTPGDYADYDEVKNVVAVDIMTALGITEGYDGKFHPADTIDRDEVAAMIARLRNGGKFDAALYAGSDKVFADVKGQWSEGYVTYCYQLGIINGLNETTFNPDGKISVVDTLKLLLCVLGYDAQLQGYVGPNYKVAVVRDAEKMGLTAGIASTDMYKEATRDQVALMFFNAMKAELVYGYISENIVTITNSLLKGYNVSIPDIADPSLEIAYNNAIISDTTLGDILGIDSAITYDCFGRPGTTWYVGSWSKFYKDAPKAASTDGSNPFGADAIAEIYHNGVKCTDAAAALLGKGVLAERYGNRLVVIDTYMTKVASINNRTGKATLENGAVLPAAGLSVGAVVAVNLCDGTCVKADARIAADKVVAAAHEHCGAYLHNNAVTVVAGETISVDETHYTVNAPAASYVIAKDGAKYEYAKYLNHELAVASNAAREEGYMAWSAKGTDKVVYRDAYGYIQFWTDVAAAGGAAPEVAYFVEGSNKFTTIHEGTDVALDHHTYACTADIVKMDTTFVDDMAVSVATYNTMLERGTNTQGTWKDGILAVHTNGNIDKVATVAGQNTYLDSFTGELVNEVCAKTGLNYHFDANTKFLVRTWDIATGAPTYEAVTGYKAMPEYLGKLIFGHEASYNAIQYLATEDGYVTDLFIDAFYVKTTAEFVYILNKEEEIGVAGLGQYFTEFAYYKAYINGEIAYVAYFNVDANDANSAWTGDQLTNNTLYKTAVKAVNGSYKGAPIYVAMSEADGNIWAAAGTYDDIVVNNGQIELWQGGVKKDIVQANYLPELTIYVVSGASDVVAGAYTGTDFVAKYQTGEFFVDNTATVYSLGNPISTLVLKIK